MNLYINKAGPSDDQTGESRGGRYAARIQIGYEKDNSPRYRYFETVDDYKKYLESKGKGKDKKKKDEHLDNELTGVEGKVKDEQKDSKTKQDKFSKRGKQSLFVKPKVEKSLNLYVRLD